MSILFPENSTRGGTIDPLCTLSRCHSAAFRYNDVNRITSASFVYLVMCCRRAVSPLRPKLLRRLDVDGSVKFQTSKVTGTICTRLVPIIRLKEASYFPGAVAGGT